MVEYSSAQVPRLLELQQQPRGRQGRHYAGALATLSARSCEQLLLRLPRARPARMHAAGAQDLQHVHLRRGAVQPLPCRLAGRLGVRVRARVRALGGTDAAPLTCVTRIFFVFVFPSLLTHLLTTTRACDTVLASSAHRATASAACQSPSRSSAASSSRVSPSGDSSRASAPTPAARWSRHALPPLLRRPPRRPLWRGGPHTGPRACAAAAAASALWYLPVTLDAARLRLLLLLLAPPPAPPLAPRPLLAPPRSRRDALSGT
jgi:hypothetical protein